MSKRKESGGQPGRIEIANAVNLPNPCRLADTSALVLLWCGEEIYRSRAVSLYARKLDLENGMELYGRCNAIWPDYGSVIRYRKLSIANTACSILRKTGIRQVIIPAAGFSMLGIELAALFPGIDVFELDLNGMEEKRELAAGLPFAEKSGLHCIRSDISDIGESTRLLCGAGWVKSSPVLLIVEGISYYLPKEAVRKLWNISAPGSPVIMEYLVPPDEVEFGRKYIPEKVFREIMYYCKSEIPITRWSEKELKNETAVSLESCISLHDIEKNLGEEISPLFPQKKDGWIEIALLCRTGN